MLEQFIIKEFNHYKQEVINQDLFDTEMDMDIINQLAISRTVGATDFDRKYIEGIVLSK